ncbi:MAG: PAAR domain-containing protein, partial [Spirochaetales bacterium]|nr:PAAR domain-containing protein [Spirochaetales bacterium]
MAGKPIATVGSLHVCPLCSGLVPHVGGPVTGPGMPGATINGQPIAVMGDMCACAGPPDTIVQGCPGVTINGKPVATVGCMTAHGGQIVQGVPGATISPRTH